MSSSKDVLKKTIRKVYEENMMRPLLLHEAMANAI